MIMAITVVLAKRVVGLGYEAPVAGAVVGLQNRQGHYLVQHARQLQCGLATLELQLVVPAVEVVGLFLQDGDVDDVFVTDVLQVGERRDHFLAQETVRATVVRLAGFLAEQRAPADDADATNAMETV